MSWGELRFGLPKPEKGDKPPTFDEMREAIFKGSRDSALINQWRQTADYMGLSGEDKYVLLAYQALLALEQHWQRNLEFARLSPNPSPLLFTGDPGKLTG